jgi:hypothetical protein
MVDSFEQVIALVQEDRWIIVTDIANKLHISCGSSYSIIHRDLGYHKICARWVSKQLTDEHKWHVWKCAYNFHSDIIYRRGFPAADCHR